MSFTLCCLKKGVILASLYGHFICINTLQPNAISAFTIHGLAFVTQVNLFPLVCTLQWFSYKNITVWVFFKCFFFNQYNVCSVVNLTCDAFPCKS